MLFPLLLLWGAYSISSYGYVMLRGWDIPVSSWLNPLDAYVWPAKGTNPPIIPAGQLFPGSAIKAGSGGVLGDVSAAASGAGDLLPGGGGEPGTGISPLFG
jgi:hypothetical protein